MWHSFPIAKVLPANCMLSAASQTGMVGTIGKLSRTAQRCASGAPARRVDGGVALLEWTVALTIIAVAMCAGISLTQSYLRRSREEAERLERHLQTLLIGQVASLTMRRLDGHRLPLAPGIYHSGRLSFADNSLIADLYRTPARSPDEESDALTSIALAMERSLQISSCRSDGERLTARACILSGNEASYSDINNVLLVSPDSVRLFAGTVRGSGRCRMVFAVRSSSIVDDSPPDPLSCSSAFVIPAPAVEAYFVDRSGYLRLARFRGSRVMENQPLEYLGSTVHFELITGEPHHQLKFTIFAADRSWPILRGQGSALNSLTRLEFMDFFLNL